MPVQVTTIIAPERDVPEAGPSTEPRLPRQRAGSADQSADWSGSDLLAALNACDERAWEVVVQRYQGLVGSAVRRVVTGQSDIDEAVQRTWMALWRYGSSIREADRLPGWLAVTARREALAVIRSRRREIPVEDFDRLDTGYLPESWLLVEQAERARYLRAAVDRLPQRQRQLMHELLADRSTYDELSVTLGMPRGSIGPMRARALRTLRGMLDALEPDSA